MDKSLHSKELVVETDEDNFVVYSDFNCPFSYALNERIIALGLDERVSYRDIQHAPQISSSQTGVEALSELSAEVAEVRRRAPSTPINIPMFRPNSGPASSLVYRVSRDDPAQGRRLRRDIFRALWVDGEDISNQEYLAFLVQELNIDVPPETASDIGELAKWQFAWDSNQEFEHVIPILISANGETVVGFPLEPEIDGFLKVGSLVSDQLLSGSGEHQQRQWILVLDDDLASLKAIIQQMQGSQVEVVKNVESLVSLVREQGMPDLIIVNMALINYSECDNWWRDTMNSDVETAVPVIFLSDVKTTETEVAAFEAGAVEFIAKPFHPKVLKARLNMQLKARSYQQELNNIARIDALTSICNRREFDMRLLTEWRRSVRTGLQLALLMIDIDKFKEYNDNYGHLRGDDCLTLVAQTLSGCMQRSTDTLARYGGEEFVALLPESDLEGAMSVAEQCLSEIQKAAIPHVASPIKPYVTVSIGVATTKPVHGNSMTLLVERADIALYQAKKNGRNRICIFEE
ncbi:MAG: diguanylate cyclase [Gammaproteobacteria bacterium]|nr:diguanylate cyclase [Gammaproteobacteria bacterium]